VRKECAKVQKTKGKGVKLQSLTSMRRSFLYIFLYLISAIRVCGQLLPIRDYTTREGLNANTVTAILRDSRGLLWVGTYNGVNWYDGARFLQPPMATRSGQVFVTRMIEDSSKQVWIATWYSGLYKFAGGVFTNYLPDPDNINAQSNSIVDLAELGGGRYLAATDNNAWIFDGSRFSLLDPGNPLLRQQIHSVLCTQRGDILIGLPQGLGWYRKKGEGYEYAGLVMRGIDINRLAAVRDEAWVTSSKGLYYFPALSAALEGGGMGVAARGGGFRGAVIEAGAAADVFPVGNGSCWYTEVGEGAWSLRGGHTVLHLTRENGLPSSLVRTVYEDAEGITWLGTEYGLAKLAPASYRYYPVPEDSSEGANIIAVGKDAAGTLWMGSFKGLYRMQDGQAREVVLGGGKPYGFVYTMYRDDRNRLWVCTTTGIWLIDKGEPKWQYMAFASSMSESGGVFWFGCMDGRILRLDAGGFREMVQSDPHEERITGIRQDAAGFLWVGYSLLGLRKFSVRNDSLVRVAEYSRENGYGGLLVRNITMDDSGRLLVGTRTHGLYVLGGETSPPVTRDLGLSGNWVKGIAANAQAVYLATNNGLDVLEGGHYAAPVRHVHFDDEGLSGEFNTLFLEGDTLWLGTAKGVLEYVLEQRMPNSLPPAGVLYEGCDQWPDGHQLWPFQQGEPATAAGVFAK
jgi:ligand-binding sensor domain-containing protein